MKMNSVDTGLLPTILFDCFQSVKMKKSDSVAVCFCSFRWKERAHLPLTFALCIFAFLYTVFFIFWISLWHVMTIIGRLKIQVTRTGTSVMTALVGVFSVSVLVWHRKFRNDETSSDVLVQQPPCMCWMECVLLSYVATVFIKHS